MEKGMERWGWTGEDVDSEADVDVDVEETGVCGNFVFISLECEVMSFPEGSRVG